MTSFDLRFLSTGKFSLVEAEIIYHLLMCTVFKLA